MDGKFWIGVLGGVITTLIVSFLTFIGRGLLGRLLALVPGLESASVRGTWDTKWWKKEEDTGRIEEHTEVVKLKQFLQYVWGTVEYTRPDGKDRTYKLRGRIKQRVFVATYEIKGDPAALDLGSFTVRMPDAFGSTMKGKYSWPDDRSHECISGDYKWKRREDENKKVKVD